MNIIALADGWGTNNFLSNIIPRNTNSGVVVHDKN
jgi:hypothetical protein